MNMTPQGCLFFTVLLTAVICVSVSLPLESGLVSGTKRHGNENNELVGLYGGKNITAKQAKYVGSIIFTEDQSLIGTAIILSNRWIVTAAYNVYDVSTSDIQIRTGSSYSTKQGTLYNVSKIILHPSYDGFWDYDIALVKLAKSIKFSSVAGKTTISSSSLPSDGTSAKVFGFGWTASTDGGHLQQATVSVLSYKSCKTHYESESDFTSSSFCTSKSGVGPCAYDFGSPLIYKSKVIGIFSGTFECGSVNYPAVYLEASKFKSWISKTIASNAMPEDEEFDDETADQEE